MAKEFTIVEVANFMRAHYKARDRDLHNTRPRYNVGDPKKGGSNLILFKGKLAPADASKPITLDVEEWRNISLYIFNNLTEVQPYIE